jgi:transcriptional regulator with XRE-family HTH domain
MSVKDRIIKKRKELGLNQTELAKRAGLKPPAISQYESGARNPSYDAIIKLANALSVKVDYLVSGIESENDPSLDPFSEILVRILQNLSASKKEEVIEYALLAAGQNKRLDILSADPKQYARYIFEHYFDKKLPIDVFRLADKMDVKIIKGELNGEAEALLLKRNNTIILDKELQHEARVKFAIATLIGHLIIPWHTKEIYYYRKFGKSTLLTENTEEIEASSFTTNLITPPEELEKDLLKYKSINASLQELKELADEKYKVSLNVLCNRLVEQYKDRFAVIVSSNYKITKPFSSDILIKDKDSDLDVRSKAYELLKHQSEEEEFKEDKVPATTWIVNAKEHELVYESSVFNPKYKSVFTLITRINK